MRSLATGIRLWGVGVAAVAAVTATGAFGGSGAASADKITTIAGHLEAGFGGDGGPATSAWLSNPSGVAVDGQGNVYVADTENYRVRRVSSGGKITTFAGTGKRGFSGDGGPATSAQLSHPNATGQGLAADGQGNVYIADAYQLRKVSRDGTIKTIAGTGAYGFSGDGVPATSAVFGTLAGVAVDGHGNVFLADRYCACVRKVSAGGTITTFAGTAERRGFAGDGGPATSAQLDPTGVAVDGQGNVYIADGDRVRRVDPHGTITTVAGGGKGGLGDGGPATSARLVVPEGVAVDGKGNLYIADVGHSRVRKVSPDGTIRTVAGGGSLLVDGVRATSAKLDLGVYAWLAAWVAVDAKGNVYISETGNNRVRRILSRVSEQTCTVDYCVPRDWNAHPTQHLPARIRKDKLLNRHEPLNVIFSAASDVKIGGILTALAHERVVPWKSVLAPSCMSVEAADVTGNGRIPQGHQLRLGGCTVGNTLSATGHENHARLWAQRVPPSGKQAWFATVSFETACIVRPDGTHQKYVLSYVHGTLWHCINGGPGSFGSDGYDKGARSLVDNVCTAAKRRGWYASFRKDKRPAGVGQNGVGYSGYVYVLRVGLKPPQPAPSGVTRCGA